MDAAALRGELGNILSGFSGEESHADPFSAPNEWEERKRAVRAAKPAASSAPQAKEGRTTMSSSRRAQQAAAKAARSAKAVDEPLASVQLPAEKPRPSVDAEERSFGKCKLPVCANWWEELAPVPSGDARAGGHEEAALRERAEVLYEKEVKAQTAAQEKKHGADHRMMKKLLSAGTVKDKIAALTVQVQESSFHSLPFLRQLIAMAERPAKEIKIGAVEVSHLRSVCVEYRLRWLRPDSGALRAFSDAASAPSCAGAVAQGRPLA